MRIVSRRRISVPTLLVWALILMYVVFFSAYSCQRHTTLTVRLYASGVMRGTPTEFSC